MMKNNQFKQLNKIIKSRKSHAGFTLIELLSGLIMSTIVVAGLGFGLYQLTKTTRNEAAKIEARNESLRAMDFVSDELRRAQALEVDTSFGNLTNTTDGVAQDYTLPTNTTNGTPVLALQIPGVAQSIIYTIATPNANANWKGPLVLYRWGPNMNANGEYNDPADPAQWDNEPLIDGIDDSIVMLPEPCVVNANTIIASYTGFFACMEDDDGDGIAENEIDDDVDGDGDGVLENDDVDGLTITAQLYFNSTIDTLSGGSEDTNYRAATKVVARARTRNTNASEEGEGTIVYFRTLNADYHVHTMANAASEDPIKCNGSTTWTMRSDFINGSNTTTWIHDPDRQGQPIKIDTNHSLQILSIPVGYGTCEYSVSNTPATPLSRGNASQNNQDTYTAPVSDGDPWTWDSDSSPVKLSEFTIDFGNYLTFNGNDQDPPPNQELPDDKKDYHETNYNDPNIPGVPHVKVYKKGSIISSDTDDSGYDDNPNDIYNAEDSLGKFLYDKKYAIKEGGYYKLPTQSQANILNNDGDDTNDVIALKNNERIIAVEIGQVKDDGSSVLTLPNGDPNPGFDLQDTVFILSTEKFMENHVSP